MQSLHEVAPAPAIPVVLVGWCIAQLLFSAVLAAMVAVLPDHGTGAGASPGIGHSHRRR